jgi:hypothetical protein
MSKGARHKKVTAYYTSYWKRLLWKNSTS